MNQPLFFLDLAWCLSVYCSFSGGNFLEMCVQLPSIALLAADKLLVGQGVSDTYKCVMGCGSFPPYDQVLNPDDACLSVVDVKVLSTPQFVYLISQYPGMFGNPCCRLLFIRCNRPGGGNHRLYFPNEHARKIAKDLT